LKVIVWYAGDKRKPLVNIAKKCHKAIGSGKLLVVAPVAANTNSFDKVISAVLGITDYLCWGVIIFAGATWMFGNRNKAIEHLIGGSSGYLIIRHAKDIQEFLKGL